jgi:ADP-heptose:LPS heptosyltransferase
MSSLDLVITLDSAPAHLAGALGVPTRLFLPFSAEWRWLIEREDSIWYPRMRLLRQVHPGDWSEVIAGLVRDFPNVKAGIEDLFVFPKGNNVALKRHPQALMLDQQGTWQN